jgi:hypothetical protein
MHLLCYYSVHAMFVHPAHMCIQSVAGGWLHRNCESGVHASVTMLAVAGWTEAAGRECQPHGRTAGDNGVPLRAI